VFRQTGAIETVVPKDGEYTNGQVLSSEEMEEKFGRWGDNSAAPTQQTPTNWTSIFQADGVKGVLDAMATLNKTKEQVSQESGIAIGDIDKAIGDYNAQGAGTGTSTGGTTVSPTVPATPVVNVPTTTPTVTIGPPGTPGTPGTNGTDGTNGTNGGDGKDGKDGRDGKTGLLTSLVNATPIASQLFKPEIFKADTKVSGLFDLVMRARA
jgi:hypothetical protein